MRHMKSKKASKVEAKIDDITNRSQLLHRLVQSCFGYTYHNGIELNRYFPISFTVNWTYCWSLHITKEAQLSELSSPTISKKHQIDIEAILQLEQQMFSSFTCKPDNDGWVFKRAATSSASVPLMFATT